jgi:ubiquitin-conjugating enzyme E2 R
MSSTTTKSGAGAKHRLMQELAQLQQEKWVNVDLAHDNILRWRMGLIVVNSDSAFNGGYFKVSTT